MCADTGPLEPVKATVLAFGEMTRLFPVMETAVPTGPVLGVKSAMLGPSVTEIDCVVEFRATSDATIVIVFEPATSGTEQLKLPLWTVAAAPLQVTLDNPERASLTVPLTGSVELMTVLPFAGEVMARDGAVLSMLRVVVTLAWLPLASVAVAVKD
jgi:hypothetical protein